MSEMQANVTLEWRGPIALVRFANPPKGVMTAKAAAQLRDALSDAIAADEVRVIILTGGEDDVFIRHADVAQIARAGDHLARGEVQPESFADSPFNAVAALLEASPKPVIAAINGICMGGGLELALACTLRVASSDVAAIGLPEIRIDIFPGANGLARLAGIIGWHKARLMTLRGSLLDARAARDAGIVDEIVPIALDGAMEIALELAGRAPAAIRTIMRLSVDRPSMADVSMAFGSLLKEEPAIRARLHRFVADNEQLDQIP